MLQISKYFKTAMKLQQKCCSLYFTKCSILQIQTPFNYLLMNIVFTELISAAYGLPIDFLATYTYGWKMGRQLCEITGFILTTSGKSSKLFFMGSQRCSMDFQLMGSNQFRHQSKDGCLWLFYLGRKGIEHCIVSAVRTRADL